MTKKEKDVESQVHTWMREKGKKAMIYKARKDRRKGDKKEGERKTEKEKSYL